MIAMSRGMLSGIRGKKLALLYGGESSERSISLKSGKVVLQALASLELSVTNIDVVMATLADDLRIHNIEHCFIALHGGTGEDGTVQALLQSMNIGFTGSGMLGCAIAMDKRRTKFLWQGAAIPTAVFVKVDNNTLWRDVEPVLGHEMMIKPASEGSSIGMSLVTSESDFIDAMALALSFDAEVIAEKWISGGEYTVAILGDRALPIVQLKTDHDFYDFEAKYESNTTQYLCPCDLNDAMQQKIQQSALEAFQVLGCSGWGRIDVMLEGDEFYFLEVNTVPGMTDHSLVPMAAKAAGMSFEALIAEILHLSVTDVIHA